MKFLQRYNLRNSMPVSSKNFVHGSNLRAHSNRKLRTMSAQQRRRSIRRHEIKTDSLHSLLQAQRQKTNTSAAPMQRHKLSKTFAQPKHAHAQHIMMPKPSAHRSLRPAAAVSGRSRLLLRSAASYYKSMRRIREMYKQGCRSSKSAIHPEWRS